MIYFRRAVLISMAILLYACQKDDVESLELVSFFIGNQSQDITKSSFSEVPVDLAFELVFSSAIDPSSASGAISLKKNQSAVSISVQSNDKNLLIKPDKPLDFNSPYVLSISASLKGENGSSFSSFEVVLNTINGELKITELKIDGQPYNRFNYLSEVQLQPSIEIDFNLPIDGNSLQNNIDLSGSAVPGIDISLSSDSKSAVITFNSTLQPWSPYTLRVKDGLKGVNGEEFTSIEQEFYTTYDNSDKFPQISDEALLTLVQEQTFKYFWDHGHPLSGMARERNTSGNTVTSGGSGFGLMSMIVGVERGFITRDEAVQRWKTIFNFLESADRFHGVWSHWIDGNTGKVRPFSEKDNGGDLVETAFLVQGLLTVRQYLNPDVMEESLLIDQINRLWEAVEWTWYTKGGEKVLYWHWSPEHEWDINLKIRGHNETQIIYVLAASSPDYAVDKETYTNGYARNGDMVNGSSHYGYTLPLGRNLGGPLFFSHYSYLGLDPRNLIDEYANYWQQGVNHSLINKAYCNDNPKNYIGYYDNCWGLTASDNDKGYSAHSPSNDRGVITPTAALSSMPYTPDESMEALKFFYYKLGDQLFGEYGFYDAFNATENWVASSFLAIDQGPIICMIENHRSGLLWDLFMSSPEVREGLDKLGFTY